MLMILMCTWFFSDFYILLLLHNRQSDKQLHSSWLQIIFAPYWVFVVTIYTLQGTSESITYEKQKIILKIRQKFKWQYNHIALSVLSPFLSISISLSHSHSRCGIRTTLVCLCAMWPLNIGYRIKVPVSNLLAETFNKADVAPEMTAGTLSRADTWKYAR